MNRGPVYGFWNRAVVSDVNIWNLRLQWRHNECYGVSDHRRLGGLLSRLFRRRSKKTSKLRVTGLCEGNSPVTGEFPSQRASNAENVFVWWRHHVLFYRLQLINWIEQLCNYSKYQLRTFIWQHRRYEPKSIFCGCGCNLNIEFTNHFN